MIIFLTSVSYSLSFLSYWKKITTTSLLYETWREYLEVSPIKAEAAKPTAIVMKDPGCFSLNRQTISNSGSSVLAYKCTDIKELLGVVKEATRSLLFCRCYCWSNSSWKRPEAAPHTTSHDSTDYFWPQDLALENRKRYTVLKSLNSNKLCQC